MKDNEKANQIDWK